MSKFFKLEEFLTSETARTNKIENLPSWTVIDNLKRLAEVLDAIRNDYGRPIRVSSGYRCYKLNRKVNGAENSAHKWGWAVDMQVDEPIEDFADFFGDWLDAHNQPYDELIFETAGRKKWLHFALYSKDGQQRHKRFEIKKGEVL